MSNIETTDLTICTTCAMIYANGDWSSLTDDERLAQADAMIEATGDWRGTVAVGEETDTFSYRRCDSCHTTLAGERWSATLLLLVS